jgi:hypothetical protein
MIKDTLRLIKRKSSVQKISKLLSKNLVSKTIHSFSTGAERNILFERDEKINESLKHKTFVREKN